ncbi:acyl-CoA (8-3)-desaturase-like [Liolophura sinensis]|uniref:acyl-CoA (8-3)-desaturase-like n=1 Tax=Liolophura sinensis TaxID=3198878 RepID=UPI003158C458
MCEGEVESDIPKKYRYFTREEVSRRCEKDKKWLIINEKVYNITNWCRKHPGGAKLISHFAGQDATDAWTAFHNDKDYVSKFLKPLLIGEVVNPEEDKLTLEFRQLRQLTEKMGLYKCNKWFTLAHFVSILGFEAVAMVLIWCYGGGWLPWVTAGILLATAQAQAGWLQHDLGHFSVFKNSTLNRIGHHVTVGFLKGASSHWWNFRHFQHHAKPNVIRKDPDVQLAYLFLLGNSMPKSWGEKQKGVMPYNWQHKYFFLVGPPLLLPIYFHLEVTYFVFKRKDWLDLALVVGFFVRFFSMFGPLLGGWSAFGLYMFTRFLESHWFTWVTQMNHIPMEIDTEMNRDWVSSQLVSTCNVNPGLFNDWFTGHLNYQIEHHLFPTMPRHNYHKVAPLVQSLCKKYNLDYQSKPMLTAFADIIRSLRKSGQIWYDAYYHLG